MSASSNTSLPSLKIQTDDRHTVHVRIVPLIDNPNRCLLFDIVDRRLTYPTQIKIGRYSERKKEADVLSFRTKVVSRSHCELFLYLRDTKSTSGTFLNHVRLCSSGQGSQPVEIHDGDLVQLGVDFQGGIEAVYRAVKMRFELNRPAPNPALYRRVTRQIRSGPAEDCCCICLCDPGPHQALFVSPCAHVFHFGCIRPLLKSYPGFQCPLCRTYSDLEQMSVTENDRKESPVDLAGVDPSVPAVKETLEDTKRKRMTGFILEKMKTVFSEKNKSVTLFSKQVKARPRSFPNLSFL
ncbi:hypothetical protein G6F16_006295 [Rhizopus arrhizus]|uniref:SMAD/FHA domain-containing protein n=1 Tax=Rhizopus oryzae TaxID=64495 RepID=A0A9P6XCH3_RHIOR|nr:hypothetical protein G6F22_008379 [Rhizopus arrhizus]KAG0784823.1 hypothetical protein G6F21_009668 [Rhizopus arrhizus]KAG0814689.1 hypothetical protein G6F20_004571 [Rhizopus arrhizus]KAG0839912.1 hypothetical protein G6F19_002333 [Rhizopus arrhizus]KAG0846329.1 hypothetical protein G6F18_000129 [Rhizopus arrhizus]